MRLGHRRIIKHVLRRERKSLIKVNYAVISLGQHGCSEQPLEGRTHCEAFTATMRQASTSPHINCRYPNATAQLCFDFCKGHPCVGICRSTRLHCADEQDSSASENEPPCAPRAPRSSKSDKSCRPASHYINDAAAAAAGRVETVALSSPANRGARPEAAGANVSFAPFDLQSR